ncbi:Major Facilitator Superfamily protein [Candida parapsilosis]|uniref:Major facilitator superfamily (MFS) profile domain-containing protein n=2 Tax=Candida parapsilosis TaxID=5480 RepID=G8B6B3_CANPC|nr:uncharacterized protein CPAR2_100330 [Candida parapsilosis]KAF6047974.1 Major Facilitator Superfamily protein [Candida parapsilosis]KAF6050059.1 Major Facilitator Superfamily protein [Candida parapsilosis]KAF6057922.1 Major Facilitator Superfamily protein [Candida parapsilosis]KAF6065371.1 Major Facilitator Superfamily protein [Candida parapsilosis]KAI5903758.1 putative transporter ESBP6 [Candida parapsilosis]
MTTTTSDDSSSKHSVVDSMDAHDTIQPYEIHAIQSRVSQISQNSEQTSRLTRYRTGHSELSRIISGIRDDQHLDEQDDKRYRERGDAEYIIAQELDRGISRNVSRPQSPDSEREQFEPGSILEEGKLEAGDGVVDDYPTDGTFAWIMSICAMLASFSTWGANAGYGVFLNYYLNSNTFPEATEYDFALIGGIVVFAANFLSPYSAILNKVLGLKWVFALGLVFQTLGWIAASFATKVWHLYLSQGVSVGISFSLIFIPSTLALPTWFVEKKATSMGICVAGAGLGGLIFSLSVNKVIQDTGDQRWALRMVGFVTLFAVVVVIVLMRPRRSLQPQPPMKQRLTRTYIKESFKVIFDFRVVRNYGLQIVSLWFAIALLGYTLMLFSISSYSSSIGLTHQQGSSLTAIMNAAQVVGRPAMGLIADRIGRSNFTAMICLLISILLYAFWINAKTYGAMIAFSVIIGLIVGIGSSLAQPLAADVLEGHLEQLPAGWSAINIFVSFFCLVAEVIALALVVDGASNPYLHTQIFAGTCFFACFLVMLVLREHLVSKILKSRYEMAKTKLEQINDNVTKNGYLKEVNVEEGEEEILLERVERYEHLLRRSVFAFLGRIVYPIKV